MRRLLSNQRGLIRTIEAFFAVVLLLSSTAFFTQTQIPKTDDKSLFSTAYSTLINLDNDGKIGDLINNGSWSELRDLLQSTLPAAFWFNFTAYDRNMACLNDVSISTGSSVSNKITSIDYVCAGINGNYSVYLVRLQVAVVD